MTVYLIPDAIHHFVCLDGDTRPNTDDVPIGSRLLVADTGAEEMYVGRYYATGVLTVDQPEVGDTIDIGCTTYTFVDDCMAACDGDIEVGASVAEAVSNIVAAINGTDGINTVNPDVSAEATGAAEITVTSLVTGTAANSIGTVYTPGCCSCSMSAFGAATLAGGHNEWTALP